MDIHNSFFSCRTHSYFIIHQPYAALKAREYLDKPAIHETMVKVCKLSFSVISYNCFIMFFIYKEDLCIKCNLLGFILIASVIFLFFFLINVSKASPFCGIYM